MKAAGLKLPLIGLVTALAGTGCAGATARVAEAVGPDPRVAPVAADEGQLIVYSRVELQDDPEMPDSVVARHLPYEVLDAHGQKVAEVENHRFPDAGPMTVNLYPGTYIIHAPGLSGYKEVELVVRVDAGRTTSVHLDQPMSPPDELAGEGLFAKAPSGWRVGWTARAGSVLGIEAELRYVGSPIIEGFVAASHRAAQATISADERVFNPLDALRLGTADLAGVAGSFAVPAEATCQQVGTDHIVAVVRDDSPLTSLDGAQLQRLVTGGIHRWTELGGDDAPVVLVVGRGTGADTMMAPPHASRLFADELVRRVANASDVIGITTAASVKGAHGVRVLEIASAPASATIPLSLCAARRSTKATSLVRWSQTDEARSVAAQYFEPASRTLASGPTTSHGG